MQNGYVISFYDSSYRANIAISDLLNSFIDKNFITEKNKNTIIHFVLIGNNLYVYNGLDEKEVSEYLETSTSISLVKFANINYFTNYKDRNTYRFLKDLSVSYYRYRIVALSLKNITTLKNSNVKVATFGVM